MEAEFLAINYLSITNSKASSPQIPEYCILKICYNIVATEEYNIISTV
jgi:hypothetical protein